MRHSFSALILSMCIALAGCTKEDASAPAADSMAKESSKKATVTDPRAAMAKPTTPTTPSKILGVLSEQDKQRLEKTVASSFGKGAFEDKNGNSFKFTMEGSVLSDKSGHGRFRIYSFQDGGKMDVSGEMACVSIDSTERRIWLSGKITQNDSTNDKFQKGQYATGGYLQFRARPNSMDGKNPAAIEAPNFVDQATAEAFCAKGDWSDDVLYELGKNDLIAAIP